MPTIATSVELIFDKQLSAEIRGIWDSFTGARIRYQPHAEQGHPHITVSVREKMVAIGCRFLNHLHVR